MSPSAFLSILAVALCASAAVVERQFPGATTLHALTSDGTDLGALISIGSTVTVNNNATGNVFTFDPTTGEVNLVTASEIFPPPHAFLEFTDTTTGCGPTGPLVFSSFSADTCAVSTGFSFDGTVLEAPVQGTFEVCDSQVFYTTAPTPSSSSPTCTEVEIVQGPTAPPF